MEFRVLGPLEVWSDSHRVEISAARQLAVLGILLLEPARPVSQDELIDDLWDGAPPAAAVSTVHSCVYRLRKRLGDNVELRRDASGYTLEVPDESVDLRRFERLVAAGRKALENADHAEAADRLREALGLWRGPAFAGIDTPAVRERAALLDDLRLDATEWRAAADLELGRHETLIGELESLVGEHPYRERLWELLMTALYRSGRQAEALETYQQLYRLLDDELGVQPSPPLRELQQRILAGEPEPDSAPHAVPRMLPAAVRDFTGRADELKLLNALLPENALPASEAVVISALSGTAGVGKTALAVHWAHQVVEHFPDGQLYVNLRGFGPSGQALAPEEAIRRFLDVLGVPAQRIPAGLEAQAGLFRSLLADRRMLVLLDNAADEEQVRPLLPASPHCLVLVTSRRRLPGLVAAEAAHPVTLGVLTEAESHRLLARRLGHDRLGAEPEATRDLIEQCARLPLALAIVAARAATSPSFSLRSIADQLRAAGSGLDAFAGTDTATDLRAVFSWSLDQVTPDAARLFGLLGLDPGTGIGVPAAASLAGVPVGRTRALLAELCDANLLTEVAPGRYLCHDLLRAYAYELVTATEAEASRAAATARLLDHYLRLATQGSRLANPNRPLMYELGEPLPGTVAEGFSDNRQGLAWFEAERLTLLALIEYAAAARLDDVAWPLARAFSNFLFMGGHWSGLVSSQRTALAAAERLGKLDWQARSYGSISRGLIRLKRYSEAYVSLERAKALFVEVGNVAGEANTEEDFGWLLEQQNRPLEAIAHVQRALELFRRAGNPNGEAEALDGLGWLNARVGNYRLTLAYCGEALAAHERLGYRFGQASTLDSLGYAHHHLGEYDQAIRCFERALALYPEIGNPSTEAITMDHLGDTLHAMGRVKEGRAIWRRAAAILEELGHRDAERVRAKLRESEARRPRTA